MSGSSITVRELVVSRPAVAPLLERLGIDYCCGGERPLAEACRERGLDAVTVAAMLDAIEDVGETAAVDWSRAPLAELCDHIVEAHHGYLRRELPRLAVLVEKAERAHGRERPELHEVRETLESLRNELEPHLDDEERTLFPACRALAAGERPADGVVGSLVELEAEHTAAGLLLARLNALTGGYDAGRALCPTHRAALDGLRELERDLHEHIHEENNILFPRVGARRAG